MFICNKCGQCCRNIGNSLVYIELDNGNGVCKYLDGNLCSIYENRPLLCRIDESYNIYFSNIMSLEEYYNKNYQICKLLQLKND